MSEVQMFQILGLFYFAAGLGMMINPGFFKKMLGNMAESPLAIYLGAIMALAVGYLLVTFHNVWTLHWTILITIIGWVALIKGLFILVFPTSSIKMTSKMGEKMLTFGGIIVAILGAVLIVLGFFTR
ncbi:MAG: hypothetical protein WC523_03130 [Patescibacteria group bacterium]|jgi:uncharacterized protein YjeT (DUF2065 family)